MDNHQRPQLRLADDRDELRATLSWALHYIDQLEAALRAIRHLSHAADWADHNAA